MALLDAYDVLIQRLWNNDYFVGNLFYGKQTIFISFDQENKKTVAVSVEIRYTDFTYAPGVRA